MKKEEFDTLIQSAREADLLQYFQSSGYEVEKRGRDFYVKEFPGLCIKPEENQWYHHYTNVGRTNNSIDCLTHVLGYDFNQAVYELTGQDISTMKAADYPKKLAPQLTSPPKTAAPPPEKRELVMPEQAENMRRIFAYFCKTRKIPAPIVEELVHAGLLYQSSKNGNAVFVHKAADGKVTGAEIQGTSTYKRYKGVAAGTGDSAFTFMPFPAKDGRPKRAYLFESAIDLMSFYTFCDKKKLQGSMFISMAGLKPTVPKQLHAQGVEIISCVDNDDAGRRFETENGFVRTASVKSNLDEKGFKDWNELLVFRSQNPDANLHEQTPRQEQKLLHVMTRRN
ncbi:MAG: DUF3991 and TOPRIM domain-containing protein [Oscillospiraceae bacterium]|nr:DUF3991 and TOPRIM domain-containing protein [Oscillospiraceae bacterium]